MRFDEILELGSVVGVWMLSSRRSRGARRQLGSQRVVNRREPLGVVDRSPRPLGGQDLMGAAVAYHDPVGLGCFAHATAVPTDRLQRPLLVKTEGSVFVTRRPAK